MLRAAGNVQRCHTAPLAGGYSVSQHVYGAQCIAIELCRRNMLAPGAVLGALLVHDAPEVEFGDIPAPVKRLSAELSDAYAKLENGFMTRWDLDEIENWHLRQQNIPGRGMNELETGIIKAADYLDLGWRCLSAYRQGNQERAVREIFANVIRYMEELMWIPGVKEIVEYLKSSWNNRVEGP